MKVFNKEVEECCLCPCLDHLDMDGSPYCNILQEDIKDCNIIHKDCPFNKPITIEVIESFGFERILNDYHWKKTVGNYQYEMTGKTGEYLIKWDLAELHQRPIYLLSPENNRRLKNPQELEFMLKLFNIIE